MLNLLMLIKLYNSLYNWARIRGTHVNYAPLSHISLTIQTSPSGKAKKLLFVHKEVAMIMAT